MDDLIAGYVRHASSRGLAERTITERIIALRAAHRDLAFGLPEATVEELEDWLAAGRTRGSGRPWSLETKAAYYGHLRAFFTWATRPGAARLDYDPSAGLRRPRPARGTPHPVSDDELRIALAQVSRPWLYAIILAAGAGLRSCEIAALQRHQVTRDWIRLTTTKGSKPRLISTQQIVWDAISPLPPGPIMGTKETGGEATGHWLTGHISATMDRIGLPHITLHHYRHWFASTAIASGASIRAVQDALGHASLDTTARYIAVTDEQRRAAIPTLPTISASK